MEQVWLRQGDALTIANDLSIGANTTLDVSGSGNYAIGISR